MDNLELVRSLKEECNSISYPIYNNQNVNIGYFIPLTKSLAIKDDVAATLSQWRTDNSNRFQTVFHSTTERTKKWLSESVLCDERRLFFLIYSENDELIGQVGFKDISQNSAVTDNFMIGDITYRSLIVFNYFIAHLKFGFDYLNLETITATVLKSNKIMLWMMKHLGFEIVRTIPLVKQTSKSGDILLVEDESAAEYDEMNVHVLLKRENFRY